MLPTKISEHQAALTDGVAEEGYQTEKGVRIC